MGHPRAYGWNSRSNFHTAEASAGSTRKVASTISQRGGTYDDLGEALNFVTNRRRHLTSFGVYSSSHRNRGNFDGELRYTLHTGRLLYSLATKSPALGRSHRRRVRFESWGIPGSRDARNDTGHGSPSEEPIGEMRVLEAG